MYKCLVVCDSDFQAGKVQDDLSCLDTYMKVNTVVNDRSKAQIIDSRDCDMVLLAGDRHNSDELVGTTQKLVEKMQSAKAFPIKEGSAVKYIEKSKIIFVEVIGKDSFIYTSKHRYVQKRKSLGEIIGIINDPYFIRCHKSYAVNVRNVEEITKIGRNLWRPEFDHDVPGECFIGSRYYRDVTNKIESWILNKNK